MPIKSAEFVKSSQKWQECPQDYIPEYAFIGRSNVGKSSLINALCNRKNLAKTSQTPGKTQLINHFLINDAWYLTDLPGYGYARVSKSKRKDFEKLITDYILNRSNLVFLFVLIDSRHSPQKIDLEFMEWCAENQIPFGIIFTKSDKISQNNLYQQINSYQETLSKFWEPLPNQWITSAKENKNLDYILSFIDSTNRSFIKY